MYCIGLYYTTHTVGSQTKGFDLIVIFFFKQTLPTVTSERTER